MWTPNTGTASGLLFPVWASTAEIRIAYTGSESLTGTWLLAALCCHLSCSVLIEIHHQPAWSMFALHTRSAELLKNPQTENNRYLSMHLQFLMLATEQGGLAPLLPPSQSGVLCILALPAKNINVSWGILATAPSRPSLQHHRNLHRSKANAGSPQLQVTSLKCC